MIGWSNQCAPTQATCADMARNANPVALAGAHRAGEVPFRDAASPSRIFRISGQDTPALIRALLGDPVRRLSNARQWRYGRKGGLSVDISRAVWFAHDGGAGGGLLDLVVWLGRARDRAEAADWLRREGWLGSREIHPFASPFKALSAAAEAAEQAAKRARALAVWEAAGPLLGSPAFTYLAAVRAVPEAALRGVEALRFHPAAPVFPYQDGGPICPAMVALAIDVRGGGVGVHLTFLRPDGLGKVDLPTPRKMVGAGFAGASVRLGGASFAGSGIVVAEGVESALSAGVALGRLPIAALSATGVKSWAAWDGVGSIVFAPDNDASGVGMAAARCAAARLHREGFIVAGFAMPPGGLSDWNDAARAGLSGGEGRHHG
jgi:Toprim domain